MLGGSAIVGGTASASTSAIADGPTVLGDFESGLDGWHTNSASVVERVSKGDHPDAISSGERGLQVHANGDAVPMIRNTDRVSNADFVERPNLSVRVTPGNVVDLDSTVTLVFRFHHAESASPPWAGEEECKRYYPRYTSEEMEVAIDEPTVLIWDMSFIGETQRAHPERLDVFWYPTEEPPREDPRGETPGYDYDGAVVFDDIRLSAKQESPASAHLAGP